MEVRCGSLWGASLRRRGQEMAVAPAGRDNAAVVPDRSRRKGLAGGPTALVASPWQADACRRQGTSSECSP